MTSYILQLKIWDFSGQITKFFLQGSMLYDKPEQVNAEVVRACLFFLLVKDTWVPSEWGDAHLSSSYVTDEIRE